MQVDGAAVAQEDFERIVLDPGAHTLDVAAEGYAPYHTRFTLLSAEHATRRVVLERLSVAAPEAAAATVVAPSDDEPAVSVIQHEAAPDQGDQPFVRRHRFYEEPLFWGIIGIVVVAVGVTLGYAITLEHKPPDTGSTGVVLSGLSAHF